MKDRQRWQPEEDALLRAYVRQYGPKEWSLVSDRMGKTLDRDPKSCLERWKNYLKPGIKKGTLTPEEQTLVVSLQAKYGNKWKKIAAEVPGRTAKRLGKWWEVFKEKQQKQIQKTHKLNFSDPAPISAAGSPEEALKGNYDHILETFADKYVRIRPRPFPFPAVPLEPPPVLPPWMPSSSSSSSPTPSPSVSLTLSPSEPVVVDPVQQEISPPNLFLAPVQPEIALPNRFFSPAPALQLGALVQYCREVEEANQNWVSQRKEAAWRLNRLEQQLESEKARKRREKMEETEAKIRALRDEEMKSLSRIEIEYREEMIAVQRDEENKEAKLMEDLSRNHEKLNKIMERIGLHGHLQ